SMSPRRNSFFVERDHKGRERVVRRRSSSCDYRARMAEDRAQTAEADSADYQRRLSVEQRNAWNLQRQLQQVTNEHAVCPRVQADRDRAWDEIDILKEDLEKDKRKYEKLEEKYRQLKRGISYHEYGNETYRLRYEEKTQECELFRQRYVETYELNHLNEGRIAEKNRALKDKNTMIEYLEECLRARRFYGH
ncbi:hypothetical protein BJ875DRAFT_376748, partial [Amylocarpus encephaloides]